MYNVDKVQFSIKKPLENDPRNESAPAGALVPS